MKEGADALPFTATHKAPELPPRTNTRTRGCVLLYNIYLRDFYKICTGCCAFAASASNRGFSDKFKCNSSFYSGLFNFHDDQRLCQYKIQLKLIKKAGLPFMIPGIVFAQIVEFSIKPATGTLLSALSPCQNKPHFLQSDRQIPILPGGISRTPCIHGHRRGREYSRTRTSIFRI